MSTLDDFLIVMQNIDLKTWKKYKKRSQTWWIKTFERTMHFMPDIEKPYFWDWVKNFPLNLKFGILNESPYGTRAKYN